MRGVLGWVTFDFSFRIKPKGMNVPELLHCIISWLLI